MSAPVVEGIQKIENRSSIEINNSCNNCFPRWCCGRKVKHHKNKREVSKVSDKVPIPKDGALPIHPTLSVPHVTSSADFEDKSYYQPMPSLPGGSK